MRIWNDEEFLARLGSALESFDREAASRLVDELIAGLHRRAPIEEEAALRALRSLRRKGFFELMERAAEALRQAGQDQPQLRRQHAQALIDQGKLATAADVLEALSARTASNPEEAAEARGLLGRVYKQLYVNAVNADPAAAGLALSRRHLERAIEAYLGAYRSAPERHLWHGINAVALLCRARRDGVSDGPGAAPEPDPAAMAREILSAVERRGPRAELAAFDLATAAEACVALDRSNEALAWIGDYVQRQDADAFELASTLRQLIEVWRLEIGRTPGSLLLPLLQSSLLARKGGRVDLASGALGATIERSRQLEKILGRDGVVTLKWWLTGLERCRTVAQVQTSLGEGIGTGLLVRADDLAPGAAGLLLLTNAHVVSDDPRVQAKHGALDPADAQIAFEAFAGEGGQRFRADRLLWTSPPEDLDATLLTLDPPPPAADCFPLARNLPLADGQQKVYIIGHPGGRSLAISMQDNLLLDHDGDRLVHYRAPTEGGSSGSPVFNQQWSLIGLHHAGGFEMPRLGGKPGTYAANEGIWIQRIIREVRAAGLRL